MNWHLFIILISIICHVNATFLFYQNWKSFKSIGIGEVLKEELANQLRTKTKIATIFLVIGIGLNIISVLIL